MEWWWWWWGQDFFKYNLKHLISEEILKEVQIANNDQIYSFGVVMRSSTFIGLS